MSGNTEIGNGYGVPGGGAYYDAPSLDTTAGKLSCNFRIYLTRAAAHFLHSVDEARKN